MGASVGAAVFSGSALARTTTAERLDVANAGRTEATALRDSIVAAIAKYVVRAKRDKGVNNPAGKLM
jgi:hypothetical protein